MDIERKKVIVQSAALCGLLSSFGVHGQDALSQQELDVLLQHYHDANDIDDNELKELTMTSLKELLAK